MTKLTQLTEAELDAVTGGILNAGDGGAGGAGGGGGAGGTATTGNVIDGSLNLGVDNSSGNQTANANGGRGGRGGSGGDGGNVRIRVRLF